MDEILETLLEQSEGEVKAEIVRYFETVRRAEIMKTKALERVILVVKKRNRSIGEKVSTCSLIPLRIILFTMQ
jgi:hypothetical protein